MTALLWIGVALALSALALVAYSSLRPRLLLDEEEDDALAAFRAVAQEVGGLALVRTDLGRPRLAGLVDGVAIEIDRENHVGRGLDRLLGLRCRLAEEELAPNAALWVGDVDAIRVQYGRPRPSGDRNGLFDVYTRAEPTASEWWQDASLHEALASLPGAGVVLCEGQLTVLFDRLDADSVRTALRIPVLVREGVRRVTLH
jgi:hypothetical protein